MAAGLVLTDNVSEESVLATLTDDGIETEELSTNKDIVEAIKKYAPKVLAVNTGMEEGAAEMTQKEQELQEEGHQFTPVSHNKQLSRRLKALQNQIHMELGGESPDIIRFEPSITAEQLAIHDDAGFKSLGIDTSGIRSARQFDAALGAVTARFYSQNQYEDLGVIVPESLETE